VRTPVIIEGLGADPGAERVPVQHRQMVEIQIDF
jgi:hypothetical protein